MSIDDGLNADSAAAGNRAGRKRPAIIPVTVLTGFLGAGKTTLLNRMLTAPELADTAVIINEFGEVGLDHMFVEASSDGIIELASGCLCCTIRGELVSTLENLLRALDNGRVSALKRVVIETTGVADPGPVLHTIMLHPYLVKRYRLDGVVTVVDAVNGLATLDAHEEARRQAAVADRLVLTKTDLTGGAVPADLEARLHALNPAAERVFAAEPDLAVGRLIETGLYNPRASEPDVAGWLSVDAYDEGHDHGHEHSHDHSGHGHGHSHGHGHHGHHHGHDVNRHGDIAAFAFTSDRAVEVYQLEAFVDLLRSAHGPKLLRVKGIARLADDPERPVVVHGVQEVFHPPARLAGWPEGDGRQTRFVFIVKGLERSYVERMFKALTGDIGVDQPDAASLADNPLAPPGMRGG